MGPPTDGSIAPPGGIELPDGGAGTGDRRGTYETRLRKVSRPFGLSAAFVRTGAGRYRGGRPAAVIEAHRGTTVVRVAGVRISWRMEGFIRVHDRG
jgi:hypothetical protein